MVPLDRPPSAPALPAIVGIVLSQIARLRFRGAITEDGFREKIARIIREEMEPRGLVLLVRELKGGRIRFLVKVAKNGRVCHLVEHPAETEDDAGGHRRLADNAVDQVRETSAANGGVPACS